jgi:putative chitinase
MLEVLILGALMGILGQGARAVVGLKGKADDAKALDLSPNDLFEAGRLVTSFLIGFLVAVATALACIKSYGMQNRVGRRS